MVMSTSSRQQRAETTRENAADLAAHRPHPRHRNNSEEQQYRRSDDLRERSYIANFTKGLPHSEKTGLLLSPADYRQFILGARSGDVRDFQATPLGPGEPPETKGCLSTPKITCATKDTRSIWRSQIAQEVCNEKEKGARVRAWESQGAGLTFDLEGPDAQAVTMPPAPTLDSAELTAEMAELYLMALLRDTHFSRLRDPGFGPQFDADLGKDCQCNPVADVDEAINLLKKVEVHGQNWFDLNCCALNDDERKRHRDHSYLTRQRLFRGIVLGDDQGPYLSQFLLIGNTGVNSEDEIHTLADGYIAYGSLRVDQRVRVAEPCKDYM